MFNLADHLSKINRFAVRWATGEFSFDQMMEGGFFWTDEGSGEDDAVHLFAFSWGDPAPKGVALERLMQSATLTIDHHAADG